MLSLTFYLKKITLKKLSKLGLLFFLGFTQQVSGQQQYTINIAETAIRPTVGFLKMGSNKAPDGGMLSYNSSYLIRNGEPWFPVMGEMHFSRCTAADWEAEILKMKAAGIQVISTYVFWNYTEPEEGHFDWSGNRDLHLFLTLCKKHGMYVWLRPGPWVHAESRNGGFPDWLLSKTKALRTNDPIYLQYVKGWFNTIGQQCKGMLFKDGGPIIGMQVENELIFKKPEVYEHMKRLKEMAINAGFDLPYYSAFAQGPDNQDDFLYTLGAYPDSPWSSDTKKIHKSVYFIKPLESDADIGADLFGKVDTKVRNTFPKLGAELGGGMQPTYHRRVAVTTKDIVATAFTKVASGINGVGYYMFHGGLNPMGKTSLQESRITGYPNDLPLINYDFEAPIGAMGIVSDSYNELKILNMFLDDYGNQLATEKPFFTEQKVKTFHSADTVQASIRLNKNSGFIFLSNYQRFENLPQVKNFQLKLVSALGTDLIPAKPVSFPENSYAIWPYNLNLQGAILHYATAQPLCINGCSSYLFFADRESEFEFQPGTFRQIKPIVNCKVIKNAVSINRLENGTAAFSITSTTGRQSLVIVISKQQALQTVKLKLAGKDVIAIAEGTITSDGENLFINKVATNGDVGLRILSHHQVNLVGKGATIQKMGFDGVFEQYKINPSVVVKSSVAVRQLLPVIDSVKVNIYRDSLLRNYAVLAQRRYNPLQPGPLYQEKFHDLPDEHIYKISYRAEQNSIVKNWIADISYSGDMAAMYSNDSLVYDQFNYNDHLKIKLDSFFKKKPTAFTMQIIPIKPQYDIYVEDNMRAKREKEWLKASIKQVTLMPEFHYKLILH